MTTRMAAGRSPLRVSSHHGPLLLIGCIFLFTTLIGVSAQNATGRPVLQMLTRPEKPFAIVEGDGGQVRGFIPDLMQMLSDILNYDFQIQLMPDSPQATQVTKMIDNLSKGTVDVIGPLQITFVNERVVDFTKPFLSFGIVPVIRVEGSDDGDDRYNFPWLPLPKEVFVILKPFCAGVWLISLLCFVGVSLFLYLINRFNPRERRYENEVPGGYDDDFGIFGSFLFAFSCLVWQGYPRAPRSISGRILTAFWWIFTVIFLMSYTAKLVFYLNRFPVATSSSSDNTGAGSPEGSLQDLINDGYTFGVVKNSPEYYFFRQSRIPVYEKIWTMMDDSPDTSFVGNLEEGWSRTRQERFAFLVNSLAADYAIMRKPCDLVQVGRQLTSQGIGFGLKTKSPYVDKLSLGILELRESGQIRKLSQKWWSDSAECGSQTTSSGQRGRPRTVSSAQPLELAEFAGAFILLIIGAIIAAIALILEIVFTRRQNKKKETEEKKPEETAMVDAPAETAKV